MGMCQLDNYEDMMKAYLRSMELDIYQVDAFSRGPFTGNPAAVVPLESWLSDDILQKIAEENNLSETAFFVKVGDVYHIRWFTPAVEVALCGHATLASAYVIFNELGHDKDEIHLICKSGPISVKRSGDLLTLDFPTDQLEKQTEIPSTLTKALNAEILELYKGRDDYMCVIDSQDQVEALTPDFALLKSVGMRGVLVTAPGRDVLDFVSRGFFPQSGIDEDPVTGSAHTSLTPYWAKRLGKTELNASQLSKRKGYLHCTYKVDRTLISGKADLYLRGKIMI